LKLAATIVFGWQNRGDAFSPSGPTGAARRKLSIDSSPIYSFAGSQAIRRIAAAFSAGLRWEHGGPDWLNPARRGVISFGKDLGPRSGSAGNSPSASPEKFKFRQDVFSEEINSGRSIGMYYGTKNNRRYETAAGASQRRSAIFRSSWPTVPLSPSPANQSSRWASLKSIGGGWDLFRGKMSPRGNSRCSSGSFSKPRKHVDRSPNQRFSTRIISALEKQLGATLRAS